MKKIGQIFFYCTLILLALWLIPWCYGFFTDNSQKMPFILYSEPLKDFIITKQENDKETLRTDTKGNNYSLQQTDSLLPFFFVRQLISDGKMPDSIVNLKVNIQDIQKGNFTFRSSPDDINRHLISLYPLFESMSGRVKLEMPHDMFRINDKRIEFIDIKSNSINETKSVNFTDILRKKGFVFPAIYIAGNATIKKEYDNGYLLIDSNHQIFNMKQVKGKPYVKYIELPHGVLPEIAFVTEWKDKKVMGLFTDKEHKLYVILTNGKVLPIDITSFNPRENALSIIGNLLDWTITVIYPQKIECTAIDADNFKQIKSITIDIPNKNTELLHFTSPYDKYVKPRFR